MKILSVSPLIVVGSNQLWERRAALVLWWPSPPASSRDFPSSHTLRTGYFAFLLPVGPVCWFAVNGKAVLEVGRGV